MKTILKSTPKGWQIGNLDFKEDYLYYYTYPFLPFTKNRKIQKQKKKAILEKYKRFVLDNIKWKTILDNIYTLKIQNGFIQEEKDSELQYVFDIFCYTDSFWDTVYDVWYNWPWRCTSIRWYRNSKIYNNLSFLNDRLIFDIAYTFLYR